MEGRYATATGVVGSINYASVIGGKGDGGRKEGHSSGERNSGVNVKIYEFSNRKLIYFTCINEI